MLSNVTRLQLSLLIIAAQIQLLGLKVWLRERAYHALTRYTFRTGLVLRAGDDGGDDIEAKIAAAVEAATSGLKAKNSELLAKVRKLQAGDTIDPAEYERLEAERDSLKAELGKAQKAAKDATTTAEKLTKELDTERAYASAQLIDGGLVSALTEAGVKNPALLKAAQALLKGSAKVEVTTGENGARVATVDGKPLGDFVKGWAGSDEGKAFVAAAPNAGGGAAGGMHSGGGGIKGDMGGDAAARHARINEMKAQAGITE
ncbi:hypothetical protein [Massilia sp. METH4]|uniref:hypothetical protein n=1 Tax=Massilia sp. METH4 TaxID=3123041 RepID=UPI0030D081F3